jgi:hypothetical protein
MTIYYKNKTIRLRCSYRLTLLSLDKLATLANEEKKIFPYKILNENIKKIMKLKIEDFNSKEDYKKFKEKNNLIINTDKLIENYCKNDVIITKNSIIKF